MILNFSYMQPPHFDIARIGKTLSLFIDEGMDAKIFSMTLDNASASDVFAELLKAQLNARGVLPSSGAYILNLIVQEGSKEICVAVEKVRESIKYVKNLKLKMLNIWSIWKEMLETRCFNSIELYISYA
ncbi:hypothetical protein MLD38_021487 [Melastoma candidum]|uniref:Uncharacterized protein n=1 Tax=Melastoma candidum TaxID=119954 RepID=A0ACB9QFG3_9MYRT|nr:hypothetical protein MLD38_021487 [Melastoma candidum]